MEIAANVGCNQNNRVANRATNLAIAQCPWARRPPPTASPALALAAGTNCPAASCRCRKSAIILSPGVAIFCSLHLAIVPQMVVTAAEPSLDMAEELWNLGFFKHNKGTGLEVVEKQMDRDFICYFTWVEISETLGYTRSDKILYGSSGCYSRAAMSKIEDDSNVADMLRMCSW
ncbi:hypothetical protein ACP4OV_025845 [Aristida adscensionis]